jgi:hypothetical protein
MIGHPANTARHTQEEAFCRDIDKLLMGRLQTQADTDEAKRRLKKMTGLTDNKLISQLAMLGVTPEGLVAMHMIPLVLIAWANQGVDEKESHYVISQAERFGIHERSEAFALVEHWLTHRPSPIFLDSWKRFIQHELHSMTSKKRQRLVDLTKEQMMAVARCSGGFLGFHRISSNEHRLIGSMCKVLDDCCKGANVPRRAG